MSASRHNQKISNQPSGGGNKLQGLAPKATFFYKAPFSGRQYSTRTDSNDRTKIFIQNMLGGIGSRLNSQFGPSADGIHPEILAKLGEEGYTLDKTFGPSGNGIYIITDLSNQTAVSLLIDHLDDIILGGSNLEDPGALFIAKVLGSIPNGGLDPSFGSGGATIISGLGDMNNSVYGQIVFDSSHHILQNSTLGDGSLNFIRYTSEGNLDSDFSNNDISGVASIDIGDPNGETVAIAFDTSNNKTILCGNDSSGSVLAAFNMNGSIDTSFGVGGQTQDLSGVVKSDLSDNSYRIFDMNLDSQQRIVLLGGQDDGSGVYVARYDPSGILDQTWGRIGGGISGEVYFNDVSGLDINGGFNNMIAFDNSDNILILNGIEHDDTAAGYWTTNVFRLSVNDGAHVLFTYITHPPTDPSNDVLPCGICFDKSNNKFLLGTTIDSWEVGESNPDILISCIRRYTSDGNLDTTLCPSCTPAGVISYAPADPNIQLVGFDIKIDNKGRIIVCGEAYTDNFSNCYPYVARFVKA
jgi:uncharacterized delta-60 repeat protein